ncbi:uncharacterized protein LOC144649338 [Oculina patagonica]
MECFVLLLCVCLLLVNAVPFDSVKYSSVGCYINPDSWYRRIPSLEGQDPRLDGNYKLRENAIEKCALVSKERGYKVFAIQDGGKCLSSSTAHKSFMTGSPTGWCEGNGRGSAWFNHFYVIGEMKNVYSEIEYESLGCYKHKPGAKMTVVEEEDAAILDGNYTLRTDAISKCAMAAMKRKEELFAVHDGGLCLVGFYGFNQYGISQDCKSDGKGGPGARHVYVIGSVQGFMSTREHHSSHGCYKVLPGRGMESLEGRDPLLDGNYKSRKNAVMKCILVGDGQGYAVVGIQDGGMCVGSATLRGFNKYGISRDCKSDGKGGPLASQVFVLEGMSDFLSSVEYESLGCYRDEGVKAIPSMEGRDILLKDCYSQRNDSIQKCAVAAKVRGYKTFAIQDGGMCVGGPKAHETFGKYGKSRDCENDGKGGPWANQVYNLTGTMEDILSTCDYNTKLGCFNDAQARAIPSLEGQDPVLDGNYTQRQDVTRKCALAAKRRGHQVFAVMADGQCASGPNTDKNFVNFGYGKKQCSTMAVSNEVYIHGHETVAFDGLLPLVEYKSVGCYKDSNERAIESVDGRSNFDFPAPYLLRSDYKTRNQAIQKCALFAKLQGYKMFAVQDGGQCRTSSTAHLTYNKYSESQDCKSDGKGGPWANQVYRFTEQKDEE